ncbi:hypothetical protein [Raoultella sp. BIGb0138]|uniref:hypothetical protein n=1 Tax=Raoultella sp. BIGb0138 TaxID=2485115 RepID=UPI0010470E19|nr:hypothetical protein [Raoultella sp. BIGb0138]
MRSQDAEHRRADVMPGFFHPHCRQRQSRTPVRDRFFAAQGNLAIAGPTLTNVNNIRAIIIT